MNEQEKKLASDLLKQIDGLSDNIDALTQLKRRWSTVEIVSVKQKEITEKLRELLGIPSAVTAHSPPVWTMGVHIIDRYGTETLEYVEYDTHTTIGDLAAKLKCPDNHPEGYSLRIRHMEIPSNILVYSFKPTPAFLIFANGDVPSESWEDCKPMFEYLTREDNQ